MSHQSHEVETEPKENETIPKEKEKPAHPFMEKGDITLLSIIHPLLSPNAQKVVSFFINFANNEPSLPLAVNEWINQYGNKQKSPVTDLVPSLLSLLSSTEQKNTLNPALITTLLSMLNMKKEE